MQSLMHLLGIMCLYQIDIDNIEHLNNGREEEAIENLNSQV